MDRLRHIGLMVPTLYGGGAERATLELAKEFVRRGTTVDLVLCRREGDLGSHVPAEARVTELGSTAWRIKLPALVRYLRTCRPQALVTSLDISNAAGLARACAGVSTRIVMVLQNTLSQELRNGYASRRRVFAVAKHLYRFADDVVAISAGVADDAKALVPSVRSRLHVIYNPVVTDDFLRSAREPTHFDGFRAGEPPVVLGVGRLEPQKDFPTLLRAFRALRRARPARLVILGQGSQRTALDREIERLGLGDDVVLPGFVDNPAAWMARAAVFCLSSAWEGLGNVVIEALAVGTPVVSTDCPHGPREILDGGRFGRLVPVGDADALAAALAATLDQPRDAERLKARGAEYTAARATDAYERLILDARRGGRA